MTEYISRKKVIEALRVNTYSDGYCYFKDVLDAINTIPAAKVGPVIQCKDCKYCHVYANGCNSYCNKGHEISDAFGYCSEGESRIK